jgi:hypothetical protein
MPTPDPFPTHVLATFTRRRDAEDAMASAGRRFPHYDVRLGDKDDALDAMALGQQSELDESVPLLSVGVISGPFARGALIWGLVGLVLGALLTIPVAIFVDTDGIPRWVLVLAFAAAGALGLSSATFILGAGRQAVKEGETTAEDPTAVIRVDVDAEQADEVMNFFVEASARSVRLVEQHVDRPPSSELEEPRPLPDDRDTKHGAGVDYDAGFTSDVP